MNYPFENDTSAVIKKLARKSVRFDKKKNLFCLSAIIVAVATYLKVDNSVPKFFVVVIFSTFGFFV